ncbi:MAG: DNA-processing protein DprA [Bacteroidales bacterium]|nr:DNA-processing protein DprA [Bacteroidales bacterium]
MLSTIKIGAPEWNAIFRGRLKKAQETVWYAHDISTITFNGNLNALMDTSRKRIAIIGTRDITTEIQHDISQIINALVTPSRNNGSPKPIVISGLALGTDTAAHAVSLQNLLPTIAVLPGGINHIYPYANRDLAKRITESEGSGLLSQFDTDDKPDKAINFMDRIKTIVLMSDVVVLPATKKHGASIVAARMAYDFGIPVYALPGRIDDCRTSGNNQLIAEGIAHMVTDVDELKNLAL